MTKATKRRIIEAAFDALAAHGYADLSIKAIGEELDQSPSLIYYHFEDKDDLLLALLDFYIEAFTEEYVRGAVADPETNLRALVDKMLSPDTSKDGRETGSLRVYVELRAQAVWNDRYREKFTRLDDLLVESVSESLDAGIEAGHFRPMDVNEAAEHVVALLLHGMEVRATTDRPDAITTIRELVRSIPERRTE